MEIGTHPDDLYISVFELKDNHPGKWALIISRGRGHNYKLLITSDDPSSWANSKEEQLAMVKLILVGNSLQTLYNAFAPKNLKEFVEQAVKWGYTEEWVGADKDLLARVYGRLRERGEPFALLGAITDPDRSLNAYMISEIMERLQVENSVDTSTKPLKSFSGHPTSPAHRLG